jgi:hypothetical protein
MEWHHVSPKKKEARTVSLASKIMETAFWDAEMCIVVDFLQKGEPRTHLATFRHSENSDMNFVKNV